MNTDPVYTTAWFQTFIRTILNSVVAVVVVIRPGFVLPSEVVLAVPMLAMGASTLDGIFYTREHSKTNRAKIDAGSTNVVKVSPQQTFNV